MVASLRALLEGVIDYAGLFPPARLDMGRAMSNYMNYVQGPDDWIVGRFVCSSDRLTELVPVLFSYSDAPEIPVTVIGTSSDTINAWGAALEHDANAMSSFFHGSGERAAIEAYEVRIPNHSHIESCLKDLKAFQDVDVFVELPWGDGLDDSLAAIAETEWVGAKVRTGGAQASAFPAASELAGFIHSAVSLDLPFKLTAGLHHPLPKVDSETGGRAHGFLSVLAATGFALAHDMSRSEIENVLLDGSIEDWVFGDKQMSWGNHILTVRQIEDSRDLFESIGSCSVDEALADLSLLGLRPEAHPIP